MRGSGRGLESGMEIHVRYRVGKNGFFWRKTCGKTILQESFRRPYGYALVTHSIAGKLVSLTCYDRKLVWLRTAYYGGGRPEAFLFPALGGVTLLKYDAERKKYEKQDLAFCPLYEGTVRQSLVNDAAGEPEICVCTDAGSFCCCAERENKLRRAVLGGLGSECGTLKPVWPKETEETPVDFDYIRNDGSAPEAEPPEPLPPPEPADYAADHELFSIDEPEPARGGLGTPAASGAEEAPAARPVPAKYAVAAKGLKGGVVCAPGVPSARKNRDEKQFFEDRLIPAKRVVVSASESYLYFGEIMDGLREGRGRTQMPGGATAYEGGYKGDLRDGFGVYYYKSGKLCYAGNWKSNLRSGAGVAFGAGDGSIFVGSWKDNIPTGDGTAFDMKGGLIYTGGWKDGKRHGRGTEYRDGRIVRTGEWRGDRFLSGYAYVGGKAEKVGEPDS